MSGSPADATAPGREGYPHRLTLQTRWADNDVYGHVNNVEYYAFFDTVINRWLIAEGGLDIHGGEVIGVCAESHCTYSGGFAFPEDVEAGLRVGKLGNSSVRYEIGLFAAGRRGARRRRAGSCTCSSTRDPAAGDDPERLRASLERLQSGAGTRPMKVRERRPARDGHPAPVRRVAAAGDRRARARPAGPRRAAGQGAAPRASATPTCR